MRRAISFGPHPAGSGPVAESGRPWAGDRLTSRPATRARAAAVVAAALMLLTACAPRGTFDPAPEDASPLAMQTVFLATQRAGPSVLSQTPERTRDLRYGRVDVAIPEGHEPGQIEWPRDDAEGFSVAGAWSYATAAGFQQAIRSEAGAAGDAVFVFVPGYNMTIAEATYRQAQIAFDYQLNGPQVLFAWPSAAEPLGYIYDRDSVTFARDALERLLGDLARQQDLPILLVGHSMGGHLVTETLRQMSIGKNRLVQERLEGVVLLSPDIDVEVFQAQLGRIDPVPDPFVIVVSQRDRILQLSARLTGQTQRLGSLDDIRRLAGYPVTIIDLTNIEGAADSNHLIAATSPVAISLLRGLEETGLPEPPPDDGAIQAVQIVLSLPD
jgi:esterase/lipase superfamily enzyme